MRVFSYAFHAAYQYSLAAAFPEVQFFFVNGHYEYNNRPTNGNVSYEPDGPINTYDAFIAHSPQQYMEMREELKKYGIDSRRLIYVSHWGYPEGLWSHLFPQGPLKEFLKEVSESPVVSVSHYILHDFGFYSHVINEAIPHYVPNELYEQYQWNPGFDDNYINIVVNFFGEHRGAGAEFWKQLPDIPKRLYGGHNGDAGAGELTTLDEFAQVVTRAKGYLWVADKVAMSFAPLEAMCCGCPIIAPDNMDWSKMFVNGYEVLLYEPNSVESLKDVLATYENDPELQLRLSQNGREAVKKRFGLAPFRARWERVLDAATGRW